MTYKLLIIDDDQDIHIAYGAFFRAHGYTVRMAGNSLIGAAEIGKFKPDLIILDVMMNQADEGFVFAQNLLDQRVMIPVIISSSIAKAGQEVFDVNISTVKAILQKPVDLDELLKLIKKILPDR